MAKRGSRERVRLGAKKGVTRLCQVSEASRVKQSRPEGQGECGACFLCHTLRCWPSAVVPARGEGAGSWAASLQQPVRSSVTVIAFYTPGRRGPETSSKLLWATEPAGATAGIGTQATRPPPAPARVLRMLGSEWAFAP